MSVEKLKTVFRCAMFFICALMAFPTIMAVIGGASALVNVGGLGGVGAGVTLVIYGLSPWLGVTAFWSAAEVMFAIPESLKAAAKHEAKSATYLSAEETWVKWKKTGK